MNLIQKLLIICGCGAALTGCQKDKPTTNNYVSFKVNGVYKKLAPDANTFDDGSFLLDAGPFEKGNLDLFLDSSINIMSYDFSKEHINAIGDYYDQNGVRYWSDSGTMVINSYDGKNISGTFAFRARTLDSLHTAIRVTDGQFIAKVDYISSSPDTSDWEFPPVQPIGDDDTCRWNNSGLGSANGSHSLKKGGRRTQLRSRYLQHRSIIFERPAAAR